MASLVLVSLFAVAVKSITGSEQGKRFKGFVFEERNHLFTAIINNFHRTEIACVVKNELKGNSEAFECYS